jgi:hypothetical protein
MKLVTKYHIPVINSCLEKCDEKCAYTNVCFKMCIKINKIGKQEVGIFFLSNYRWQEYDIWSQASYRYPILWEAVLDPSDSYFLFADFVDFYTHFKTYICICKNQLSRQTGRRNLTGPKTLPTIWGTYMKRVTKYQISAINNCWEKCTEKWAYMFNVYKKINKVGKQEVGIWWGQKRFS